MTFRNSWQNASDPWLAFLYRIFLVSQLVSWGDSTWVNHRMPNQWDSVHTHTHTHSAASGKGSKSSHWKPLCDSGKSEYQEVIGAGPGFWQVLTQCLTGVKKFLWGFTPKENREIISLSMLTEKTFTLYLQPLKCSSRVTSPQWGAFLRNVAAQSSMWLGLWALLKVRLCLFVLLLAGAGADKEGMG